MRIDQPYAESSVLQPIAAIALLTGLLLTVGACSLESEVLIDNARVRALIPGQDKTVAYMDVTNRTRSTVTLVSASAEPVRAIEIHVTQMDDGVMRMRRLEGVEIAAGETIRFEPGGRHLMLFGVKSLDTRLPVQLTFADGTLRVVEFERIPAGAQ